VRGREIDQAARVPRILMDGVGEGLDGAIPLARGEIANAERGLRMGIISACRPLFESRGRQQHAR
jgi:hypothetical protein